MRHAIALVALLAATTAFAAESDAEKAVKGSGVYGTAGCGLGSMAFGNQKGGIQILAATTNNIFGTQTFGITSGTSNCGTSVFASGTKNFVEANREALAKDISRGTGESIGALAVINGDMTVGGLVAFNMIMGQVMAPILRLSQLWQDFQQMQVSIERMGDILNAAPETQRLEHANLPPARGSAPPSARGRRSSAITTTS